MLTAEQLDFDFGHLGWLATLAVGLHEGSDEGGRSVGAAGSLAHGLRHGSVRHTPVNVHRVVVRLVHAVRLRLCSGKGNTC